jgi:serine/threonine-protein kinase
MRFAHFSFDPENDRLGEGPQSEVFKAVDSRLGRTVALKLLRPHIEFDPQATERFEREAKHTSNLAHPNIATIYEYGKDKGTSYIAMEYIEGRTLDKILKKDRMLGYEEGIRISLQVTAAMALVHERGLIHRDLKPANIMVLGDGSVKLLDFGICRSTGESNITQDGMLVGTVLYMAPEQVMGDDLDLRTDVFALGAVFYHAFTGELAFPGQSFPEVCMNILESTPRPPSEVRSGFPPGLERFIMSCLAREPSERFADAAVVHGALLGVAEELRLHSVGDATSTLRGHLTIPPFRVAAAADANVRAFAGGVRHDLEAELQRATDLRVALLKKDEEVPVVRGGFILRGQLEVKQDAATIDVTVERRGDQNGSLEELYCERIEHRDEDEWGLQAKLVGSLARSLRRRLAEVKVQAPRLETHDTAGAVNLARRAHEMLHRGTSKHLIASMSMMRKALELDPGCTLALAGQAEALVRKFLYWDGDRTFLRDARAAARRALTIDAFCAEAHTSLGFAHTMSANQTEAQREFRLAIQIDQEEWLAHRLLGAVLSRLGNYQEASPLLRRAIALRPTHIGSYDHLYGVLCRMDRYQEAIEIADQGISAARKHIAEVPDDIEARTHLALLYARMKLEDDARKAIGAARALAPKDAYTCFHSGCVHALLGEADEALALLKEAQERGFFLESEVVRNPDLEPLRGRTEFQALIR